MSRLYSGKRQPAILAEQLQLRLRRAVTADGGLLAVQTLPIRQLLAILLQLLGVEIHDARIAAATAAFLWRWLFWRLRGGRYLVHRRG